MYYRILYSFYFSFMEHAIKKILNFITGKQPISVDFVANVSLTVYFYLQLPIIICTKF